MRALRLTALVAALVLAAGCSRTAGTMLAETSPTPERRAASTPSLAELLEQRVSGAPSAPTSTPTPTRLPTPTLNPLAYATGVSHAKSLVLACVKYEVTEKAVVAAWPFSFAGTWDGVPHGVFVWGAGVSDDGREWVKAKWMVYKEGVRWKLSPQDPAAHRFHARYCVA